MDTTPKYILMSEKALDDLAEFQPHIQSEEVPHGVNVIEIDYGGNWWFNRDNKILIPLFRQDQLQEMLTETHMLCAKISMFCDFYEPEFSCPGEDDEPDTRPCKKCKKLGIQRRTTFATMEQLWLGFVMDQKYNKVWSTTKKDWVHEKN